MRRALLLSAAAGALAACATPRVAYNARADFSKIRRVAVVAYAGAQGNAAADMMAQSLLSRGADVVERQQLDAVLREQNLASSGLLDPSTVKKVGLILGVDALFVGTVVQSLPEQSYLVMGARHSRYSNVTPVGGGQLYPGLPLLGVPDSQVVTSAASISLLSRLVDVETGSVLWSASMTYEGLDTASAMASVSDAFVDSLVPIWPQLRRTPLSGRRRMP